LINLLIGVAADKSEGGCGDVAVLLQKSHDSLPRTDCAGRLRKGLNNVIDSDNSVVDVRFNAMVAAVSASFSPWWMVEV